MDTNSKFDFDEWAKLAKEQPEQFEAKRKQVIQELLDNTPDSVRQRMKGLQWQIDQYRKTAKNPVASCIKISSMMWDQVLGEDGLVDTIERLKDPREMDTKVRTNEANILEFRRNQETKPEQNN